MPGGSSPPRSRTLPEPACRTRAVSDTALALHAALGLQRARVRAVVLRAEHLAAAADTPTQLSLDPEDEQTEGPASGTGLAVARAAMPATLFDILARTEY
jgi:methylmalonyl-CoA mutase N-terminal domain/subunit